MSEALSRWNGLPELEAEDEILPCCGSRVWAGAMASRRPVASEADMLTASDDAWLTLGEADWMEAFRSHPRIGERHPQAPGQSAAWSAQEQGGVADAEAAIKSAMAEGNREYEARFGRIFVVCATGKSAGEMLENLRRRLKNDEANELREAAEQLRQITQIRLKKWLSQ